MNLNEYQERAHVTANYPTTVELMAERMAFGDDTIATEYLPLAYVALGLSGEAGEFANKVKKVFRDHDGKIPSVEFHEDLIDELGDALWYISEACRVLDVSLETMAEMNLNKLAARNAKGRITGSGDKR